MKRTFQTIVLAAGLASVAAFAQDTATITQTAAMNQAVISQAGNAGANDAAITQNSPANLATIDQTGLGHVRPDNISSAAISQGGDGGHVAHIAQQNSDRVTASIVQEGSGHQATLTQADSQLATIALRQDGVNQVTSMIQSTEVPTAGEAANLIRLSQAGEGNAAYVTQHGANAVLDGSQTGSLNYANIDQAGVESFISFAQGGQNNELTITQQSTNASISASQSSSNNVASIEQTGAVISGIFLDQSGSGNTARIHQNNTLRSAASVTQGGSDNFARITQDDINSSQASIVQASSNNFAVITQTGAGQFVGSGGTATILQTGGDGNRATINQHF